MANEAVIIELLGDRGDVVRYACLDGETYTKGQLVWFKDARQISGASIAAAAQPFAGIVSEDKLAGDGSTSVPVYTYGYFDLIDCGSGAITAGDIVFLSGQNLICSMSPVVSGANIQKIGYAIGVAQETASASEAISVKIG